MNKNLALVIGAICVWMFVPVTPIFALGFISVGSREAPAPPKPGEEYSWLRKWCMMGWREYGIDHMERCTSLIDGGEFMESHGMMESYGCGASCRLYYVQIEPPQQLANGWLRVHAFSSVWLRKFDADTKTWSWATEDFRSRPANNKEFWFAQCDSELFGSGQTSKLRQAKVRSVYIESGKYKGFPKRTTVDSAIYYRWHKLCHLKSID